MFEEGRKDTAEMIENHKTNRLAPSLTMLTENEAVLYSKRGHF